MNRADYLLLCQKASMFERGKVPPSICVKNEGITYVPKGYEITFRNGNPVHKAILSDTMGYSVTYARLEDVKTVELLA